MTLNDAATIAELHACHERYEQALMENDVAVLDGLFWDSPHALRFGVTENLHGSDEIRAFRQARPALNLARKVTRLGIMSFGDSAGIVNLEFARSMDGVPRCGRQTQFWFRLPDVGWRIVSAHVSLLPAAPGYLEAAAARIGLPIAPEYRAGVNDDLSRITTIAGFLMDFPLPQEVEAAPVFRA
jgi:hypothetical protein